MWQEKYAKRYSPKKNDHTEKIMKICFVAPANNYHTQKWAGWFSAHNHEVHVISFINAKIPNVQVHYINTGAEVNASYLKKLNYLKHGKEIRSLLEEIKPDIINAHYATSYGTAMAVSKVHPYIVSVWGSDVYEFPQKNILNKIMVEYCLKKADYIFSTSKSMALEASKYTDKKFYITPFGVDIDLFNPNKRIRQNDSKFIIGTVKALNPKYGIDTLLKAASLVYQEHPEYNLEIRIAGKGNDADNLKRLADNLGINHIVKWLGFISQEDAATEWANMDIGITSSSSSESFGVSAVECEACETPIIISDVPGLKEATDPGKSSLVVPRKDARALANAIEKLHDNPQLRETMGKNGRAYVKNHYEINACFRNVESIYSKLMTKKVGQ